jgi:hypothetical protein
LRQPIRIFCNSSSVQGRFSILRAVITIRSLYCVMRAKLGAASYWVSPGLVAYSPVAAFVLRPRVFRLRQGHAQRSSSGHDTVRNEPGQSVCRSASWGELTLDDVARGRAAAALVVVAGCLSPLGFGGHAEPLTCFHTRSFRTSAPAPGAQIWRPTAAQTFFQGPEG